MSKPTFDAGYARLLRRWNELFGKSDRTWREQQEFEAADRKLAAMEVGMVRAIVSDYDEAMQLYEAGNLGTVEL